MKRLIGGLVLALGLTCALFPVQAQQAGGAFLPTFGYEITGNWIHSGTTTFSGASTFSGTGTFASGKLVGTAAVLTTPVIDGVTYSAANDRQIIVDAVAVSGAAIRAAVVPAWTAPANAHILRVWLDITTASTGASTIDIGYTATTSTTSSDTLLDGISGTPAALFDSMNAALDSGANAKAQSAASGKWITVDEVSGDTTGLVGVLYIQYIVQ